jgi:hyperosmotically inducible protein
MKNLFIAFLLGLIIAAGAVWYLSEGRRNQNVRKAEEKVADGAEKVRQAVKDTVGEIRTEDIKQELERTGKVVRQKARKIGEAVASAADNARITGSIKAKLIGDPDLSALKINVDTTDGLVTLSGTVKSHEEIAKAMKIALDTEGVREVASTLQVKPAN